MLLGRVEVALKPRRYRKMVAPEAGLEALWRRLQASSEGLAFLRARRRQRQEIFRRMGLPSELLDFPLQGFLAWVLAFFEL